MTSKAQRRGVHYWPVLAALVAAGTGQWCFPVAMGEWYAYGGDAPGLRQAAGWMEREASHWCRLAEAAGSDEEAGEALRRCTAENPAWGMGWTALGKFEDAVGGDGRESLLRGARLNRRYRAYRAVAEHYFERGEWAKFTEWAQGAMGMGSRGERIELLEMRMATPGGEKLDLVAEAGEDLETMAAVLELAMGRGWEELAERSARRLEGEKWVGMRGRYEEWMLARGRGDLAGGGGKIGNEGFTPWPTGKGRDWRLVGGDGMELLPEEGGGLRIVLSGQQRETATVMWAYVDVGGDESLVVAAQAEGISGDSGLRWRLEEAKGRRVMWQGEEDLRGSQRMRLETKGWKGTARLVLEYRRKRGTVRSAGEVVVKRVWMQ